MIHSKLGQGGFGEVYLAHDRQLNSKPVVVKLLAEHEGRDDYFQRTFAQEKEALARIDHPGVVGVLDAGEAPDGRPFLVLQYVNGVTLQSLITKAGLEFRFVAEIVKQIGDALTAAHARGVWHRDLKPANIMVQNLEGGQKLVKIIDFGIAALRNAPDSQSNTETMESGTKIAGTLPYMAPEQLGGHPTAASDIYAMGVIAYEMLAGHRPFQATSGVELFLLQRRGVGGQIETTRPGVPRAAGRSIENALAFEASHRHASARNFGDELALALTQHAGSAESPAGQATREEPNLGKLVAKMCDRREQEDDFRQFFLANMENRPGVPQAYLIHGSEGECHESLVERLMYRIGVFARAKYGAQKATVCLKKIPWQYDGTLEQRRGRLVSGICESYSPMVLQDLSPSGFARMVASSLHSFYVIQHDIRAARWDKLTAPLFRTYLDFWGDLPCPPHGPQLIVFLNVIYPLSNARQGASLFLNPQLAFRRMKHRGIQAELSAIASSKCAFLPLQELRPVTRDDVWEWFSLFSIYDSEELRLRRLNEMFREAGGDSECHSMAEVEARLGSIHGEFIAQRGYV